MSLEDEKLMSIKGGGITGTLLNYIIKGFNFIFELGKTIGSAIRRGKDGSLCNY